MKRYIIKFLEYKKADYDIEYPPDGSEGREDIFHGSVKKIEIKGNGMQETWTRYIKQLRDDGWKLYSWSAIIKGDIVRSGINIADAGIPNHQYGYNVTSIIQEKAENAQEFWFN